MSWLGTLGKIAAGVAAPFTGGLSLAALPAIGGLEGGLSDKNHDGKRDGWGAALKGGAIGGIEAAIPYGLSKVLPAGAGGSFISKLLGGGASKGVGIGETAAVNGLGGAILPGMTQPFSGGGGSFISKLLGAGKDLITGKGSDPNNLSGAPGTDGMADIASLLGKYSASEANNRGVTGNFMQNYDQLKMNAEAGRRTGESDALKKLQNTEYIAGGGHEYTPPHINSGILPDFGFGPKAATENEMSGASSLRDQMLNRIKTSDYAMPTDPSTYTEKGKMEKGTDIASLITGGIGAARKLF